MSEIKNSRPPLVSIIMPTYKVERFFEQCLSSVTNQTLRDIEIIPVDDGSPDKCGAIMDAYAAADPRVKPIHQKNAGYGAAVNAGLAAATGTYIAIVETDDWIERDMLETLYNRAVETGIPVVKASFMKHEDGRPPYPCSLKHITHGDELVVVPSECLEIMIYESSIWSALYRRDFLTQHKIKMLETTGAAYQDAVWKFCVYASTDRLLLINRPLYNYRVMVAGSSSAANGRESAMFVNYAAVRSFLDENGLFSKFAQSYYVHQIFDFAFHSNRLNGEALALFSERGRKVIAEAEGAGIFIDQLNWSPDLRYYVLHDVMPNYEKIKASGKIAVIPRTVSLAHHKRPNIFKRLWFRFKYTIKVFLIRTLRVPFYRLFLLPLEREQAARISAVQQTLALQIARLTEDAQQKQNELSLQLSEQTSEAQRVVSSHINQTLLQLLSTQNQQLDDMQRLLSVQLNQAFLEQSVRADEAQRLLTDQISKAFLQLLSRQDELLSTQNQQLDDMQRLFAVQLNQALLEQSARTGEVQRLLSDQIGQVGHELLAKQETTVQFVRDIERSISPTIPVPLAHQFEYYIRANRAELPSKIEALKAGMDAASQFQVDRYFDLFTILPINMTAEFTMRFPLTMSIFSDEERLLLANRPLIMNRLYESYQNLDMSNVPISLTDTYYECGLKLVPYRITEELKRTIALDCGASLGDSAIPISRYGFKQVHSFEPLPSVFSILEDNIKKNHLDHVIFPHCLAIDEASGKKFITVVGDKGVGSFVSDRSGDVAITCISIDGFCSSLKERVGLIKLDVEGKELAALRGAEATIRKHRPVILVAVYHTWLEPDQIFTVKDYIESLNLGYEFQFKWLEPSQSLLYEHWIVAYCKDQFADV